MRAADYFGAHAEYRAVAEHGMPNRAGLFAHKPVALTYGESPAFWPTISRPSRNLRRRDTCAR